jgi:glucose/arabinose dehydrogenase
LNDDGSVPQDNPFVGQQNARPEIWSLGHRNAQGMDWQPGSNLMFQTEHGPSGFDGPEGGDEVNIVEKGKNYGWPTFITRNARRVGVAVARVHACVCAGEWHVLSRFSVSEVQGKLLLWLFAWRDADSRGA